MEIILMTNIKQKALSNNSTMYREVGVGVYSGGNIILQEEEEKE